MCGLAGVVSCRNESNIETALIHHMCNKIVDRRPEDEGIDSLTFVPAFEWEVPLLFIAILRNSPHTKLTDNHPSGQRTRSEQLWRMSVFELWQRNYLERLSGTVASKQPISAVAGLRAAEVAP